MPRGTTTYTDNLYARAASYTDKLLSYDVRAYYTIEGVAEDHDGGVGMYGRINFLKAAQDSSALSQGLPELSLTSFPNPFEERAMIEYILPETGPVRLSVYDAGGRKIKTLVDREQGAGPQGAVWDGTTDAGARVGGGVYFIRIETVSGSLTGKLVLVR